MRLRQVVKQAAIRLLARQGFLVQRADELTRLADLCGSDKGTRLSAHRYTRIYDQIFRPLKHDRLALVEIGLLRVDDDKRRVSNGTEGADAIGATRAPSLEMWRTYFPNAQLFGFDIDDFSGVTIDRCTILQGDMSSRADLKRLASAVGRSIDILVEDGSHVSHHQQIALATLFPHLKSGGIYVIEDLHWQDDRIEKTNAPKTRNLLRALLVNGVFDSPFLSADEKQYLEEHVVSVSLFDSLTRDVADSTDALAVLVKR
jgi:hypothetical protein